MRRFDYRIYPSLLDAFQRYKDSESQFDSFPNVNSEGEHTRSLEDIETENRERLINMINRVPIPWTETEAMDRGTVFNRIVDQLSGNEPKDKDFVMDVDVKEDTLTVDYNKRRFIFPYEKCVEAGGYFMGSECQVPVSSLIATPMGIAELYGYIDELKRDTVYDIKTTSFYTFGKYQKAWQKHLYTYCLHNAGDAKGIEGFEYSVFTLYKTAKGLINVKSFDKEYYSFDFEESRAMLIDIVCQFAGFLETYRERITDTKIFGMDA